MSVRIPFYFTARLSVVYWRGNDLSAEDCLLSSAGHGTGESGGLVRGFGLLQATALNMSNMVGVGPFITIPLIIASMGGPQCMLGWLLGAVLAMCDGLIWSELAAA